MWAASELRRRSPGERRGGGVWSERTGVGDSRITESLKDSQRTAGSTKDGLERACG